MSPLHSFFEKIKYIANHFVTRRKFIRIFVNAPSSFVLARYLTLLVTKWILFTISINKTSSSIFRWNSHTVESAFVRDLFSSILAMSLLKWLELFVLFVSRYCESSEDFLAGNEQKIKFIFRQHSTLNILSFDHENLVTSLRDIFPLSSFVMFGFSSQSEYMRWLENCQTFHNDTTLKIAYYERSYQKLFNNSSENVKAPKFNVVGRKFCEFPESSPLASDESFADSLDRWFTFRLSAFVFVSRIDEFEWKLFCLVNRGGTFLIIIVEQRKTSSENVHETVKLSMRMLWRNTPNLKIFILIGSEIYIFNPFKIDDHDKCNGILELCNENCTYYSHRTFNGYSMRVEVFESAYSVPRNWNATDNTRRSLDYFYGPDINVGQFIQQQLNVSSN